MFSLFFYLGNTFYTKTLSSIFLLFSFFFLIQLLHNLNIYSTYIILHFHFIYLFLIQYYNFFLLFIYFYFYLLLPALTYLLPFEPSLLLSNLLAPLSSHPLIFHLSLSDPSFLFFSSSLCLLSRTCLLLYSALERLSDVTCACIPTVVIR